MAVKTQGNQVGPLKRTGYFYEGKEITLTKNSGRPTKQAHHNKKWWPEDKKIEAATAFAVMRDYKQVSKLTGIPEGTLRKFKDEPWWYEVLKKVKKEKNEVLDDKITDALDKVADIVLDRFDNGEVYYDRKTGETYRIPVRVKDIAYMTSVLFDKRQIIRGEPTTRTETMSRDQKLEALKETFENLAKSKGINPKREVIEHGTDEQEQTGSEETQADEERDSGTPETGTEDQIEDAEVIGPVSEELKEVDVNAVQP